MKIRVKQARMLVIGSSPSIRHLESPDSSSTVIMSGTIGHCYILAAHARYEYKMGAWRLVSKLNINIEGQARVSQRLRGEEPTTSYAKRLQVTQRWYLGGSTSMELVTQSSCLTRDESRGSKPEWKL
jgi:hypothetical protein